MFPRRDFGCIVADPSWPYKDSGRRRYAEGAKVKRAGHARHYPSMSLKEICALGVPLISSLHNNCLLFLWTTNAFLVDGSATRVIKAWGFVPKTLHTWVKMTKDGTKQRFGCGSYGRNSTEHFIVATRGKPNRAGFRAIPTAHFWPWQSRHSQKPKQFYQLVESACSGPRLELFARIHRANWVSWGDEILEEADSEAGQ